jgi:hypothetical protein
MTTIQQFLEDLLKENFLNPVQIIEVMARVKELPETKTIHWNDPIDGYPLPFKVTIWFVTKNEALAWIDETCPEAFFRELFVTYTGS